MTITTAPLPSVAELLFLHYNTVPGGNALAGSWLHDGDLGGLWTSRSAWSLAILAEAFKRAHGRQPVVAFPEYICNQSLWPLRQGRAELLFYPVRDDTLAPDWPACERLPQLDLFVLVHYFGWPNEGGRARMFCDSRKAWLVEDAAHVLAPFPPIGEQGDAVLYSPHKLLAVPDGAVLVARNGLQAVEHHLVDAARAVGLARPHTTGWRIRRLIQASPLGPVLAKRRQGGQPDFASDPEPRPMAHTPGPSPAGAALIGRADLAEVAARRRANYAALRDAIGNRAAWVPLFRLHSTVAPYRLVMRCSSEDLAADLYARFRAAMLPVESWPDLPPEIGDGAARRLRRSLLLLPCHQGCDGAELARAYASAMEGLR